MPTGIYEHKRRTAHVKITCSICLVVFDVPPAWNDRKFCSIVCYIKSQIGNKNAAGEHKKYGSRPERNLKQSLRQRGSGHWNWNPDRKEQERKNKLRQLHRSLLNRMILLGDSLKEGHTSEQLGYTAEQLRKHIESLFKTGMSWENHGRGSGMWHIDHIRPIYSFPLNVDPSIVSELSNLRPLWEEENLKRPKKGWEVHGL